MTFRMLVLGGTSWLGGAVAREALARGHRVTCLARGESGPVPAGAELVAADRWQEDPYTGVRGPWDAVLEVSWQPELVRAAVEALGAAHWVYVSSASVYADDGTPGCDETAPRHPAWSGVGVADLEDYGPAKVACEDAVVAGSTSCTLVRPGLIGGYGDRSDRFGYWPARFARRSSAGEPVLAPRTDAWCQVIDAEDLARWLVDCAEQRPTGAFNAVGDPVSLGAVLQVCAEAAGGPATVVPAEDAWLSERGIQPWAGEDSLPLWLPQPDYAGFMSRTNQAAKQAGLRLGSLVETAEAALRWEHELGLDRTRRAGLGPARERGLLDELVDQSTR
jgi:nucleoside-diphosphate-sugar epimerase